MMNKCLFHLNGLHHHCSNESRIMEFIKIAYYIITIKTLVDNVSLYTMFDPFKRKYKPHKPISI